MKSSTLVSLHGRHLGHIVDLPHEKLGIFAGAVACASMVVLIGVFIAIEMRKVHLVKHSLWRQQAEYKAWLVSSFKPGPVEVKKARQRSNPRVPELKPLTAKDVILIHSVGFQGLTTTDPVLIFRPPPPVIESQMLKSYSSEVDSITAQRGETLITMPTYASAGDIAGSLAP